MTIGRFRYAYVEVLEQRNCLTAITFVEHEIRPLPASDVDIGGTTIFVADINNDGKLDIVESTSSVGALNRTEWIENLGDGFARGQLIAIQSFSAVQVGDVDNDGDNDIVATRDSTPADLVWFENEDGRGHFGPAKIISLDSPIAIASDLDGDNDLDVLTMNWKGELSWLENEGGEFVIRHSIEGTERVSYRALHTADIDSDGDTDLVLSASSPSRTVWYENREGHFFGRGTIGMHDSLLTSIQTADIDGDGDTDVITTSGFGFVANVDGSIIWHENEDGLGGFGSSHLISSQGTNNAFALDLNGDGGVDVISHSDLSGTVYVENRDGRGSFDAPQVISSRSQQLTGTVFPGDLDADGDVDAISSIRGKLVWYENRLTGDADDNGNVDFTDFLLFSDNVGKRIDAVWRDGDFDGDGSVDFADFLLLSQNFGNHR